MGMWKSQAISQGGRFSGTGHAIATNGIAHVSRSAAVGPALSAHSGSPAAPTRTTASSPRPAPCWLKLPHCLTESPPVVHILATRPPSTHSSVRFRFRPSPQAVTGPGSGCRWQSTVRTAPHPFYCGGPLKSILHSRFGISAGLRGSVDGTCPPGRLRRLETYPSLFRKSAKLLTAGIRRLPAPGLAFSGERLRLLSAHQTCLNGVGISRGAVP